MTHRDRIVSGALIAAAVLIAAASATAAQGNGKSSQPTVSGRWTMHVKGSPHGQLTLRLALEQKGKNVAGTFASPHGDMPVTGEFVDGTLTLATSGGDSQITFNATLEKDGTLVGFLSSSMGDMTWTAERMKDAK